jgi:hypothetical protein
MNLYSIKTTDRGWRVTKFDRDLNVTACYRLTEKGQCDCPQALNRHQACRHQAILKQFQQTKRLDSDWMLDFDRQEWLQPLAKALEQSQ